MKSSSMKKFVVSLEPGLWRKWHASKSEFATTDDISEADYHFTISAACSFARNARDIYGYPNARAAVLPTITSKKQTHGKEF